MPPLPGSRRDFYWYHILDFFLFVLLTLRIESRALPLRSDNWELNKCSITELQPRLFFFSSFLFWDRVSFNCSDCLSTHCLRSRLEFWIFLQSNWAFFFFFTSGHILDFKDNPSILQTSLPLPSWYFFFLSTPSLYFLRQFCCVIQAGLDITFLLLQFLLLKWQGTGMRVMFEKKT